MRGYDLEQFRINLNLLGCEITSRQENMFLDYFEILTEWNQVMNLTAITEFQEVLEKHFVDSLTLLKLIPDLAMLKLSLIDVGTGAGFPGIPLKIVFPDLRITLLDSLGKRVRFLNEVIERLSLEDISAIHGRAEDFSRLPAYREQYDLCVSRAVANLSTLSEYCLPFVKEGGLFVSYKSERVQEEAEKAKRAFFLLGGEEEERISFLLPGSQMSRTLLSVRKKAPTPKKYPRKAGLPTKEPL